jgi:hypothetical protein
MARYGIGPPGGAGVPVSSTVARHAGPVWQNQRHTVPCGVYSISRDRASACSATVSGGPVSKLPTVTILEP